MSNYGNNRRRPRKRITGRFYAFLTVMVVLVVMVGVLVGNRGGDSVTTSGFTPNAPENTPVLVTSNVNEVPTPAPDVPDDVGTDPSAAGASGAQAGMSTIDALIESDDNLAPLEGTEMYDATDLSVKQGLAPEWRNFLLLGSDARVIKKTSRTDTIMIASINANTGRVKLCSIMRDLIVPITKNGTTKNVKINSVIHYGGPELVMKTVNELFGMNITEYVMVNFASFQKVIDILGGVKLDVTEKEMDEINKSIGEQAKAAGMDQAYYLANRDSMQLKIFGKDTLLTGIQALGYARIRHVGSGDYQRTERQRDMLDAVLRKVKDDANALQLMQIATSMWGELSTNVNMMNAVGLAATVIKNGAVKVDSQGRIPGSTTKFVSEKRDGTSALYDCDFEANANLLYSFIYER